MFMAAWFQGNPIPNPQRMRESLQLNFELITDEYS